MAGVILRDATAAEIVTATGTVRLTFPKEFMRFENRAPDHSAPSR